MSECQCKNILYLQPQCDPTLNIEPNCPVVLNVDAKDRGPAGKDATINGVNALTIVTEGTIDSEMNTETSTFTITSKTFTFEQGIASDEWVIEHNLNKYPSVSVVDSANNVITPEVEYIDLNNIVVRMNGATTGKAFLN